MIRLFWVDAFADKMFAGNPAAICVMDEFPDDKICLNIAKEMNLSETAFVKPATPNSDLDSGLYDIRWFTPVEEVALCGHATLAAAKVMLDYYKPGTDAITFWSKSGELPVRKSENILKMEFPANPPVEIPIPDTLGKILGTDNIAKVFYNKTLKKLLVHLSYLNNLKSLNPDFHAMLHANYGCQVKGMIITAEGDDKYDFYSRYFAPWVGVNEDPVTGSAHTVLLPYWSGILGETELAAYQASKRGGELFLKLEGNRAVVGGQAIVLIQSQFQL